MGFNKNNLPKKRDSARRREEDFCEELKKINFQNSRLSPEILQHQSDPRQGCGDYQYTTLWLIHKLQEDKRDYAAFPRMEEIDDCLLQLIQKFGDCVAVGRVTGSMEAQNALVYGFGQIRMTLPTLRTDQSNQTELDTYMEDCVQYLQRYSNLIDFACSYDIERENTQRAESMYLSLENEIHSMQTELEWALEEDSEVIEDFSAITQAQTMTLLTPRQNALRMRLIDLGVKKTVCALWQTVWEQRKLHLSQMDGKLDLLRVQLSRLPTLDCSEKITTAINNMTKGLLRDDERLEEETKQWNETRGQISAMTRSLQGQKLTEEQARRLAAQVHYKEKEQASEAIDQT